MVKNALVRTGDAARPEGGVTGYLDDDATRGLLRFQYRNGLKPDAIVNPGGPTETALNAALSRILGGGMNGTLRNPSAQSRSVSSGVGAFPGARPNQTSPTLPDMRSRSRVEDPTAPPHARTMEFRHGGALPTPFNAPRSLPYRLYQDDPTALRPFRWHPTGKGWATGPHFLAPRTAEPGTATPAPGISGGALGVPGLAAPARLRLRLGGVVGPTASARWDRPVENRPQDIAAAKSALYWAAYQPDDPASLPQTDYDADLSTTIHNFQAINGLKPDGVITPGGETETKLNALNQPAIQLAQGAAAGDDVDIEGAIPDAVLAERERDRFAESLLKDRGLEIMHPSSEINPRGNQITQQEYEALIKEHERKFSWGLGDWLIMEYQNRITKVPPTETHLRSTKDSWISDNATSISVAARKYGLPDDLLAGVAWTEIGGDPEIADTLGAIASGEILDQDRLANISLGDIQIQARHAARMLGMNPDELKIDDVLALQNRLQNDRLLNLDLAAQHIAELRDRAYPDQGDQPLSDDQYKALAWMFNAGYDQRLADDPSRVNDPIFLERSKNGQAVLKRRDHSKALLDKGRKVE